MLNFFKKLFKNIGRVFSRENILWHLLAIALTGIIVYSGFDWIYFVFAGKFSKGFWFFPAMMLGSFLPILLPIIFLVFGKIKKSKNSIAAGLSLAQAAILGSLISSLYKAFTGRIHPPVHFSEPIINRAAMTDISHGFRFGFWEGGIFWGWPSSHATIAFAMAFALIALFPKNKIIRYIAIIYALYVGLSVSVGIHWFSELIAGAIIGTVIGVVVGKSYFNSMEKDKKA